MNKVRKTTLDNAIKAKLNISAAHEGAFSRGTRLSHKEHSFLCGILQGYCNQLQDQSQLTGLKGAYFWDMVTMCADMSDTPYETAYKLFALFGIEVQ